MGKLASVIRPIPYVLTALILGLGLFTVSGVVTIPLSIETLAREASLVCRGKVVAKTCLRDPAGRTYTRVELEVSEVWKGSLPGNPLLVVHGGGRLGTEQVKVTGQIEYQLGEEVVAFLVLNDRHEGVALSLGQGKFQVGRDPRTGVELAWNLFHGLAPGAAAIAKQSSTTGSQLTVTSLRQRMERAYR